MTRVRDYADGDRTNIFNVQEKGMETLWNNSGDTT